MIDSERGVPTTNIQTCADFYTQVLFFNKVSESRDRCTVAFGSDEVVFRKAHKNEVRSMRDMGFCLNFRVTDIRSYYERVRATSHADFRQELEFMQPGVWQFVVVDCNGYTVGFANR